MTLVDPFIPVPQRQRPSAQQPRPQAPPKPYKLSPPPKQRRQKLVKYLTVLAMPVVIIGLSRIAEFLVIGEIGIAVYAVLALVLHIPSRVSFALACLALISVVVQLLTLPDATRAANTAVFAFLFLAVGTLSLALEARYPVSYSKFRTRR